MPRKRNRDGSLPESAWQQQVEQLAAFYGWRGYHTHDSRRSAAGFPDLVLVRAPELLFAELKGAKTRVTPEQQAWLDELGEISDAVSELHVYIPGGENDPPPPSVEVYLWRPADFDDIHARLSRGRVKQEPIY